MHRLLAGALILALVSLTDASAQKKTGIDLELAFVVDAAGSIGDQEMLLQRLGAGALVHSCVLSANSSVSLCSISVS